MGLNASDPRSATHPNGEPHDAGSIPEELIARPQWVVWRWVERDGKPTKPPFNPVTDRPGDATDPRLWMTYEAARACAGRYDGIGFAVSRADPYCGVDLDHCLGPDGVVEPWALAIVQWLASYTERTPSGQGLRVWVKGTLPPTGRKKTGFGRGGAVELYDSGRYFTVSGNRWEGTPATIEPRHETLTTLHAELFAPGRKEKTGKRSTRSWPGDDEILDRARKARNGDQFAALFDRGDTSAYDDDSRADLALCAHLAFWFGGDEQAIDRLFRRSALYRDKWDRDDYRERTISKALEGMTEFYEPKGDHEGDVGEAEEAVGEVDDDGTPDDIVLTCLADIEERAVEWEWEARVPRGMLTLVFGDPDLG